MPQTKKLPVGFDPKKPNRRIGHLVPKWTLGLTGGGFVAVDSQKDAAVGRMAYHGRDVTSADILKKVKTVRQLSIPDSESLRRLDVFLSLLEPLKIGHLTRCVDEESFRVEEVPELSSYSKPLPLP